MIKINCLGQSKTTESKSDVTKEARIKMDKHIFIDAKKNTK